MLSCILMFTKMQAHSRLLSGRGDAGSVSATTSEAGNVSFKLSSSALSRRCRLFAFLSTLRFGRLALVAGVTPTAMPVDPAWYCVIVMTPYFARDSLEWEGFVHAHARFLHPSAGFAPLSSSEPSNPPLTRNLER